MIRPDPHRVSRPLAVLFGFALLLASAIAPAAVGAGGPSHEGGGRHHDAPLAQKAVLFAADGMRQDLIRRFADQGYMPTMRGFLRNGASATGNGMLTQAPPEHRRRLVHDGDRRLAGRDRLDQQHVLQSGPSSVFATGRTAAFDPGVLQAETIAQSAERGGQKVAQVEWAGGRNGAINGPTIDFQSFFSGRGVATNFIGSAATAVR